MHGSQKDLFEVANESVLVPALRIVDDGVRYLEQKSGSFVGPRV